ncbi:MAG: UDP-3-O-(3-hydroxymyristoyl)glucosamine N-acyltransferase [Verrucomicrobia bacterium]|nr:UDP-3-O-(3-hydroxymyristoyl)glucosamine N-acyltransferase [Verrucomicrobiota bacterium]
MPHTVADIAKHVRGEVHGDSTTPITGFAPADSAKRGDLTFAETDAYFAAAEASAASAILVAGDRTSASKTLIRVKNARVAFAEVLPLFFAEPVLEGQRHPTAVIPKTAFVDDTACIGPHCVIGEHCVIGARAALLGGNHLGDNCAVGEDTKLFPNVVLYARTQVGKRVRLHAGCVIGSDGFGYVFDAGVHHKVLQVGHVIIGDDVEIGANSTVDRGAIGATVIGKGTKIDNLVQIAHNVSLGEHSILCAQVGIAGSVKLGNYAVIGGQVGIAGHLKIGNQVTIAAQSGVMHDIPDGGTWLGSPAQPDRSTKRQWLALQQLPELLRRVKELEKQLAAKKK